MFPIILFVCIQINPCGVYQPQDTPVIEESQPVEGILDNIRERREERREDRREVIEDRREERQENREERQDRRQERRKQRRQWFRRVLLGIFVLVAIYIVAKARSKG